MNTCWKWHCQTPLVNTVKRTLERAGTQITVVDVCCPKCGWHYEDYEIVSPQSKPRIEADEKKPVPLTLHEIFRRYDERHGLLKEVQS